MVKFEHISLSYGNQQVIFDLSFEIPDGKFVVLIGPSGCGKTTTLKMINRLIQPNAGHIYIDGEDIAKQDKVTLRRRIGYVIQQTGLFPHMTVAQNIACVPKILKWDRDRIDARVDELLRLVHLDPAEFAGRYPSQLSGGQQQRVGLVRALAAQPRIMLLDEPFGAIDALTRASLQDELLRIHRGSGKTFIFVTHDVAEAMKLATKILVVDAGRVQQFASPDELIARPATPFVRELLAAQGFSAHAEGVAVAEASPEGR